MDVLISRIIAVLLILLAGILLTSLVAVFAMSYRIYKLDKEIAEKDHGSETNKKKNHK